MTRLRDYDDPLIVFVACVPAQFVEAAKVNPLDPLAVEVVRQIGLLYRSDEQSRAKKLNAAPAPAAVPMTDTLNKPER